MSTASACATLEREPTSAEEGVWLFCQLHPDVPIYNDAVAFAVDSAVDPRLLSQSIDSIVARHECLRTLFIERRGIPRCVVLSKVDVPVEIREAGAPATLGRRIADRLAEPYDLERGPLLRLTLWRSQCGDVIALGVHHIVCDGWSLNTILSELVALYAAARRGEALTLPEIAPFEAYAAAERDYRSTVAAEAATAFWREQLNPLPEPLTLDRNGRRRPPQAFAAARTYVSIGPDDWRATTLAAMRARTSHFAVLAAAFARAIGDHTGRERFVIGTPFAKRLRRDHERMVGLMTNLLPLVVDLSATDEVGTAVERLTSSLRRSLEHARLPFERIVREAASSGTLAHRPVIQVTFAHQNVLDLDHAFGECLMRPFDLPRDTTKFDLAVTVEAAEGGDAARVRFAFSQDVVDSATVDALASSFLTHVRLAAGIVPGEAGPADKSRLSIREEPKLLTEEGSWARSSGR